MSLGHRPPDCCAVPVSGCCRELFAEEEGRAFSGVPLSHPAIDALAQQVRVPAMTRIFLDPVNLHLAHRHLGSTEALTQIRM